MIIQSKWSVEKVQLQTQSDVSCLNHTYSLWIHKHEKKTWEQDTYDKICTISTPREFWMLLNNISEICAMKHHIYLMQGDIMPMWEHADNINGSRYSIRIVQENKKIETLTDMAVRMVSGELTNCNNVNGISYNHNADGSIFVKIWGNSKSRVFSQSICSEIQKRYKLGAKCMDNNKLNR